MTVTHQEYYKKTGKNKAHSNYTCLFVTIYTLIQIKIFSLQVWRADRFLCFSLHAADAV